MEYRKLMFLFLFFPLSLIAQDNGLSFGGKFADHGYSIVRTSEGNFAIAGSLQSSNTSSDDIYWILLDSTGLLLSEKTFGETHHDIAWGMSLCQDGGYIICGEAWKYGYGREAMYILKLDQYGTKQWKSVQGGYHTDQGFDVISVDDGYVCLGYTSSQETTRGDFYCVKINLKGEEIWENYYGTAFLDFGFSIKEAPGGGYWLLGNAGGFFNMARADFKNPDSQTMIIRIDEDGNEIFRKIFGGKYHDWGKDMLVDEYGNLFIIGSSQRIESGSFDMYLAKLDSRGNLLWEKSFGNSDFEYGNAIDQTADGNLLLVGTTKHPHVENPDIFIVKTTMDGEHIWSQTLGGVGSDYGHDLVCLPDSGCVVVGSHTTDDLGTNVFVTRMDKDGNLLSMRVPDTANTPGIMVHIFPNPINAGETTFEWQGEAPKSGYDILIYNLQGQIILEKLSCTEETLKINLSHLPAGTFIYKISSGDRNPISGKLIKQ